MVCIGDLPKGALDVAYRQLDDLAREGYTVITKAHYEELTDGPRVSAVAEAQEIEIAAPALPDDIAMTDDAAHAFAAITDEERMQVAIPTEEFLRLMAGQYPEVEALAEQVKVAYPKFNWDLTPNRYAGQGRTAQHVFWFIVHTTEGSYASAYSIFKNPATQAGPHILTSKNGLPNGVDRMAHDSEGVWTAAHPTYNKGGDQLEQGDRFAGQGGFTEAEYKLNGHLYAYYAQKNVHDLALAKGFKEAADYMRGEKGTGTRPGIIGHHHVPYPSTHWDPGPNYDFDKTIFYARQVLFPTTKPGGPTPNPSPSPAPSPNPAPAPSMPLYRVLAGGKQQGAFEVVKGSLDLAGELLTKHDEVRITKGKA